MALCQAITKHNYRPCANKARHGHDTCASHKKFFHEQTWKDRFLYGTEWDIVLLGYQEDSSSGRLEKHVRDILRSGRITVTEDDVKELPCASSFVDIFLVLCDFPSVNPTWNKKLLLMAISYYFSLFNGIAGTPDPYEIHRRRIRPILHNPNMNFGRMLKFMLKAKHKRDTTNILMHHPVDTYQDVFSTLFLDYTDEYVWYSDEFLRAAIIPMGSAELKDYFNGEILPRLKQRARPLRQAKRISLDPMKEEIVAKVFHPNNVERWLNEGGWDCVDMMFG